MIKPLLSLLFLCCLSVTGIAQDNPDELQMMQSLYGMEKRAIVAESIELSDAEAGEFWALYDEYELKRQEIGKERFALLSNYVSDYGVLKPQDAEAFMKKAIPLRNKTNKLLDTYYKKVSAKTDPVVALQFYQIENYLTGAIRMEIMEEIYITKKQ